jgi:hypothetical protein
LPYCTSHGLRKTGAAIAAENGATAHELMSIFGWLTLKEAERYTRTAEQKKIAGRAMTLLERGFVVWPCGDVSINSRWRCAVDRPSAS